MVDTTRMNLSVSADIPGILAELAGSKNRMGEYLENLLRQVYAGQQVVTSKPGELEMLTGSLMHLSAKMKELEARLVLLEQQQGK